ncbi:haloacid dehalogenase type II [soil metagenome]
MTVIVFDVNGTLLDLAGLDEPFEEVFGGRAAELKRLWFARLVHTASVLTTLGSWQDFGVVGRAVLADVAAVAGVPISTADADRVLGAMTGLPAHPDVAQGLTRLREAGADLVALTNSGQRTAEAQLAAAGIDGHFDRIMSVDAVLRFKPDRAVYDHCRDQVGARTGDLLMVAAHDWDCAGAMRAGWRSGFLERPGQSYNALLQPATYRAPDLVALAEVLITDRVV